MKDKIYGNTKHTINSSFGQILYIIIKRNKVARVELLNSPNKLSELFVLEMKGTICKVVKLESL